MNRYAKLALAALGLWALWRAVAIADALVGIEGFEKAEAESEA